jgi:hypothetical protein
MINRISKKLSKHIPKGLELIHLDLAGPFPQSIYGNRYFIFIIDSYTRVNWIILLKHMSDAIARMKSRKVEFELAIGDKIIATRTDNAPELIQAILECRLGTRSEVAIIALSHQNSPAEWNLRTAEANMRAMLKEAGLSLEF